VKKDRESERIHSVLTGLSRGVEEMGKEGKWMMHHNFTHVLNREKGRDRSQARGGKENSGMEATG